MDFSYILRALLKRKWIILGCTFLAILTTFVLTMGSKKVFRSTAQLSTGFTVSEQLKLNDDNFNPQQIELKFNNVIENITSPKVRTLVSYSLMLHDLQSKTPFKTLSEKERQNPDFKAIQPERAIEMLQNKLDSAQMLNLTDLEETRLARFIELYGYDVTDIGKSLQADRFERTDYVNIAYSSENPYLSAFAANEICKQFKIFYGLERTERSASSIVGIDSIVRQKKAILDEKISAKNQFMSAQSVVDVNMQGSSNLNQISQFESLLIEEKGQQQSLSYKVQELQRLVDEARSKSPSSGDPGPKNNNEYLRLRQEYRDVKSRYDLTGGTDAVLKSQMDELNRKMSNLQLVSTTPTTGEVATDLAFDQLLQRKIDAEAQLRSSTQKIASYNTKIAQLRGGLSDISVKGADIKQLDKEIEMANQDYIEAKDRKNLADNLTQTAQGSFKQTIIAEPPLRAEPSKRMLFMALSGMLAFLTSGGVFVGKALADKSIRTPSNFHRLTGLPVLGIINKVKFTDVNILEQVSQLDELERERGNIFKEFLRKLRFGIENSGKRIFLFTSTEPNQGKTSLIQAIAYSLSLGKKRVLIIDTNFCNNDLTIAIQASPVLENFALDGQPFDPQDVRSLVTKTSAPGVEIIGCAGGDYTPSEGLPKNHLLNYLEELKSSYDYIFLEGAPLNGFTDTKELTAFAEGMIAVFSAEQTLTASDSESIDFLKANTKFIGAVLNKVQDENIDQ